MTPVFTSPEEFRAILNDLPQVDADAIAAAKARDAVLTKPPGALGRLEDLALWYAGWRAINQPRIEAPQVIVFAGNHGVTAQGISAFPAEVTAQMVANFEAGGAAVNQLAKTAGARMDVHALDLENPTGDFTKGPAMSNQEVVTALKTGWDAVDPGADLLVVGEMGIGNTTSAAALACALFGGEAADWCGRGTGLDAAGVAHKAQVVAAGLAANPTALRDPMAALAALGGRELAAMAGAIARARTLRIPVILDGFITTAAASVLECAAPGALDHCVAGHLSDENAHGRMLAALKMTPLLDLGLRLGEASGATLAIPILRAALACHSDMSTFAQAGVSDG